MEDSAGNNRQYRVLLVDDHPLLRQGLREILGLAGNL